MCQYVSVNHATKEITVTLKGDDAVDIKTMPVCKGLGVQSNRHTRDTLYRVPERLVRDILEATQEQNNMQEDQNLNGVTPVAQSADGFQTD